MENTLTSGRKRSLDDGSVLEASQEKKVCRETPTSEYDRVIELLSRIRDMEGKISKQDALIKHLHAQ